MHNLQTVLIDADITAYQVCATAEVEVDWGDDVWTLHSDFKDVKREFKTAIESIMDTTEASHAILAFTSPDNFRKTILPTYKENRAKVRRPMHLARLRDWAKDEFNVHIYPSLEGDDVLGILSTKDPDTFVYSADKDMRTLPANLWAQDDGFVYQNDERIADWYFMMQTLTGDPTDNYKGCPSIGPKRAQDLLGEPGLRSLEELWSIVVRAFESKGLTADDALTQARCARILRHTDWNPFTGEVALWQPPSPA
jgi:DNA polymerase-1